MRHMLLRELVSKFSRRGFLRVGAVTVAAAAVGNAPLLTKAEESGLSAEESRTLLKFTRDLFPHDRLDDSFYAKAITPLQDEASKDAATRRLLSEGVAQLNSATMASAGKPYAEVTDENIRIAAIKKIESSAFFGKVYNSTMTPLYNQPELWAKFGYEGPSSAQGGYLHRGFNDIDWLPQ
jgi:TAT (twin-arginine translocation) pathway signal sequence